GKGTCVEIWLPAAETPIRAMQPEVAAPQTRALRILAVDDDPIVLLNTATVLADMGHDVIQADDGEAALAMLTSHPVDLLLTDYAMPRMSGGELVEKVAMVQPDLKVIVLSGYADLPQGKSLPVHRLSKPFSDAELARAIAEVID